MNNNKVQNLNKNFKKISYSGGAEREGLEVDNIFDDKDTNFHCSKKGYNHDLILEFNGDNFTMTNFTCKGPDRCTALVKNGVVFICEKEPKVDDYKKYNDTKDEKEFKEKSGTIENGFYFETDSVYNQFEIALKKPLIGKFVFIKFLSARTKDRTPNIDVKSIGIIGKEGIDKSAEALKKVPLEWKLTEKIVEGVMDVDEHFIKFVEKKDNFLLLTNDDQKYLNDFKELEKVHGKEFNFYTTKLDGVMIKRIISFFALEKKINDIILLVLGKDNAKWPFIKKGENFKQELTTYIDKFKKKELKQLLKSAERVKDDIDIHFKGIKILCTDSFEELVIKSDKAVLVDLYADWCPPCRMLKPIIISCAFGLYKAGVKDIEIYKYDSQANDADKTYFFERGIPNVKLFKKGDKTNPLKYGGARTCKNILEFLNKESGFTFDVDLAVKEADGFLEHCKEKIEFIKKFEKIEKEIELVNSSEKKFEHIDEVKKVFEEINKKIVEEEKCVIKELEQKIQDKKFISLHDFAESVKMKRVKKISVNVEEFEKILAADPKKLIVVDFFTTWCGPCIRSAPLYYDLSDEYKDVDFYKIDADKNKEVCQKVNVNCYPTFKFFKDSKEIFKVEGADMNAIRNFIKTNK